MKSTRVCVLLLGMAASVMAADLQPGRERIPGAETMMGFIASSAGYPLRIFITRPQNASGKLPVIFVVGWLSCDSVEQPKGPRDGFVQLVWDLAGRSGLATYRVDKPGVGDSGGPKCAEADFDAELSAYRSAFAAMKELPFLDTSRVYMLGFSNGGGFAPLVAGNSPVRGYMVFSGWYKTWLEHMLEHERRRMRLSRLPEAETNARMRKYATFYDLYLNHQQTPGQIIGAHPELKEIWYDEPETQYGRPAAYYQQLQALNLAEAWEAVSAPVLAVHGQYDWIMSEEDYLLLVQALNAKRARSAEFAGWPKLDHDLYMHATAEKAFHGDPQAKYDPRFTEFVLQWLKQH